MQSNPLLIYAGQELGERGMDCEGFSGRDGRTTIFDYWMLDTLRRGYFAPDALTAPELQLRSLYRAILHIAQGEKAITQGQFFDLMYANPQSIVFNSHRHFAFLRKHEDEVLLGMQILRHFEWKQSGGELHLQPAH